MYTKEFVQYLIQKLKSGNRASIHLNALPANYVTRLDLSRLECLFNNSDKSFFLNNSEQKPLSEEFLNNLLNNANFSFEIDFWDQSILDNSEEQQNQLKYLAKRLDSIYYQSVDNYLEYGLKTFGFGYPLIIKRDQNDPKKIIKAPLLIWQLEIEKSNIHPNKWTIKKADDQPIAVNEILVAHCLNEENIVLDAIPQEYLEDSIIQKEELLSLCNKVLNQFNRTESANESLRIEKAPASKKIEEIAEKKAFIQWSGIFGLFKNQKQSIIKELEWLENNIETFNENEKVLDFQSKLSGIDTDPSQERIINNFSGSHIKIIQGPPGTGKSQTLTALLTNALDNQMKCLVICEKKTAIEVIFNNLEKIGMGSYCAVIDDINRDRERIIQMARSKMEGYFIEKFPEHLYQRNLSKYEDLKNTINAKLKNYIKPCFGDFNHKELTGLYLKNQMISNGKPFADVIDTEEFEFNYTEYEDTLEIIRKCIREARKANAFKSGLRIIRDEIFNQKPSEKEKHEILEQLSELHEQFIIVKNTLDEFRVLSEGSYNKKSFFQNISTGTGRLFNKKMAEIHRRKKEIWKSYIQLEMKFHYIDFLSRKLINFESFKWYSEMNNFITDFKDSLKKCLNDFNSFWQFQEWKRFFYSLPLKIQKIVTVLIELPDNEQEAAFKSWYLNESLRKIFYQQNLQEVMEDLIELVGTKDKLKILQQNKITYFWQKKQDLSIKRFLKEKGNIKRLYNFRRNKEFGRKNALRKIINEDFELFTDLFPVILTNPVACSSVLPLTSNLFDIVIFDEASQLRIEDTFGAYLRGAYKVISGDRHQMPPSSYFQSDQAVTIEGDITDEIEESIYMAESESLLEFSEENAIRQTYLEFHYRSRHPFLIDFSNAAFYGNRLVPMPVVKPYKPIHFHAIEGIYHEGINEIEADAVTDILINEIKPDKNGNMPSVGVATTNLYQRNLIWDKITERAYKDSEFSKRLAGLNANGFFVKNLENIQGDERDIIIISTTFGPNPEGNFRQNFGPLNQANGYRLLNVIITRAKQQLYVCSSIPAAMYATYRQLIEENGNNGRGIFYAYLAYAHAIESNNETERMNILDFVASHCKESNINKHRKKVNGPFEQVLANYLAEHIDKERIKSPYQFGGFYIDTAVLSNNPDESHIAMECNGGEQLDENEAYIHLEYRKKLLENYGFDYHYLWSLDFWQDTEKSLRNMVQQLK